MKLMQMSVMQLKGVASQFLNLRKFFTLAQIFIQRCQITLLGNFLLVQIAQESEQAPYLEIWAKLKKLSEIKPPLVIHSKINIIITWMWVDKDKLGI